MTHKSDLQLAFSGKEIASQRIKEINSRIFDDQSEKHAKYQKLLNKSEAWVSEIKRRIVEDIDIRKQQLEELKEEFSQINTGYEFGKITIEAWEKQRKLIRKKHDRVKAEGIQLNKLLKASTSSDLGGQIPIDIDTDVDEYGYIRKNQAPVPDNDAASNLHDSQELDTSQGEAWSSVLIGLVVGLVLAHLSTAAIGWLIGGIIAGFLVKEGAVGGMKVGFAIGIFGPFIISILLSFYMAMFNPLTTGPMLRLYAGDIISFAVLGLVLNVIIALIGGAIGGLIAERVYPYLLG